METDDVEEIRSYDGVVLQRIDPASAGIYDEVYDRRLIDALPTIQASRGGIQYTRAVPEFTSESDAASESLYDTIYDTLNKGLISDDEMRRQLLGEWTTDNGEEMQDDDPATIVISTGLGDYTVAGTFAQIKRIAALSDKQKHEFATTLERLKQERGHD